MSKTERRAYLDAIRGRYRKAKRADKSKILDEFCAVCGYHRKYALRRLNQAPKRTVPRRPGRASRYACPEVMTPLRAIWLATDQMASKRLRAALPLWLPHYEARYGEVADDVRHKLLAISAASIDRVLAPVRAAAGARGLSGTKPGTLLKHQIPLQGEAWDVSLPGFIEADTVAHWQQPGWGFRLEPDDDRSVFGLDGMPRHLEQGGGGGDDANQGDPAGAALSDQGIRL